MERVYSLACFRDTWPNSVILMCLCSCLEMKNASFLLMTSKLFLYKVSIAANTKLCQLTSVGLQLFERKGRGFIIVMVCYDQGKREEAGYRNKLQASQVIAQNKTFF